MHWESDGGTEYEMSEGTRTERGTEITLYLNDASYEFSNEYRVREVIRKYCSFMPIEIYLENANAPAKEVKEDVVDATVKDGVASEADKKEEEKKPTPINDTNPLWAKHPNDCSEEDYKKFYRDVFYDYKSPYSGSP